MRFILSAAVAVALAVASLGTPVKMLTVESFAGQTKPNSFIVTLKPGVSKDLHLQQNSLISSAITHPEWETDFLHGFAGTFNQTQLDALRASGDVLRIEENGIMTTAPWGLARLSSRTPLTGSATALNFTFRFDSTAGRGVDIFIVDTGINTAHQDFGGRATFATSFGGLPRTDDNGHGSHVAGTAVGTRFGVAKAANVHAVKVLNSAGSGSVADIVSGLNFVLTQARSSGRPTIASMSLGGGASTALDNAVASLTAGGVHVTVAAGNDNANAANSSPARAPSAITVVSCIADARASFSNFGASVDVFAPGSTVTSAWIGSTTATNTISGYVFSATPHIAGLVAYLIGLNGNVSPATMAANIRAMGLSGVLSGIPSGTTNTLAHNGQ
ncbi:serine protease [Exidia glandulosa HHB12029]|uniref:Serine protease n=1 Tax=Exidia glandulosa HHB12029 TaxID=1314781 RepID=A0A165LI63_EXIGL|nr:serine protease [Exidia glandulosa HHB12029]